ncbi:MAG: branched-chain amino acid ABC transporter permease [Kofleriaceae bacterium]
MSGRDPTEPLAARIGRHKPNAVATVLRSLWPLVVGLIIALVLQAAVAPMIGPFYAKLLLDIGIAIVLAASLNIVNGFAGQFSIGHAGFMMVGGYAAAMITYYGSIKLGWVGPDAYGVDVHGGFLGSGDALFIFACIFGGVVAAVAGLVVGLPSLRLRGDYLAIVTLGFGEIVRVLVQQTSEVLEPKAANELSMFEAAKHIGGPLGFTGTPTYVSPTPWLENAAGEQTGHAGIFFAFMFVTIVLIVAYRLKSSSKGRALLAVRENEIAAEAMGVDTARAKVVAFVTAAFFAGIGGALFAHEVGVTLNPKELGFQKSIDLVIMVVLGGMGSITGVVLAATVLTILPELFREFAEYRMPVYALALIIVMIVRPQGLLGIKELWELQPRKRYLVATLIASAIGLVLWLVLGWIHLSIGWADSLLTAFSAIGALALILGLASALLFAVMLAWTAIFGERKARRLSSEAAGADLAHAADSPKPGADPKEGA